MEEKIIKFLQQPDPKEVVKGIEKRAKQALEALGIQRKTDPEYKASRSQKIF